MPTQSCKAHTSLIPSPPTPKQSEAPGSSQRPHPRVSVPKIPEEEVGEMTAVLGDGCSLCKGLEVRTPQNWCPAPGDSERICRKVVLCVHRGFMVCVCTGAPMWMPAHVREAARGWGVFHSAPPYPLRQSVTEGEAQII